MAQRVKELVVGNKLFPPLKYRAEGGVGVGLRLGSLDISGPASSALVNSQMWERGTTVVSGEQ